MLVQYGLLTLLWLNTLRLRPSDRRFSDDIFKCIFHEYLKMRISNTIRLIFVLKSLVDNTTALLQKMATGHFLNQWWPKMATHIYIIRAQWVNMYHMYPTILESYLTLFDTFVIGNRSIFKSIRSSVLQLIWHSNQCIRYGNTRDVHLKKSWYGEWA